MHIFSLSVVLLVGAAQEIADAVKCFQCKSGFDTGCGIPFRPEGLPTCTGRFCSLVDAKVQGYRHLVRGCQQFSSGTIGHNCTQTPSAITCTCHTDYCNKRSVRDWGTSSSGPRTGVQTNLVNTLTCFAVLLGNLSKR